MDLPRIPCHVGAFVVALTVFVAESSVAGSCGGACFGSEAVVVVAAGAVVGRVETVVASAVVGVAGVGRVTLGDDAGVIVSCVVSCVQPATEGGGCLCKGRRETQNCRSLECGGIIIEMTEMAERLTKTLQ